jgi:hypothetical protein
MVDGRTVDPALEMLPFNPTPLRVYELPTMYGFTLVISAEIVDELPAEDESRSRRGRSRQSAARGRAPRQWRKVKAKRRPREGASAIDELRTNAR